MAEVDWEGRVRDAFEAYNRGAYERVLTYASEDVELRRIEDSPESRDVVRGRDRVANFLRPDAFVEQSSELIELITGEDSIIANVRFTAQGAGSGLPVEIESYIVWRIADDLVTRVEFHNELEQARNAAGLEGSPGERADER